VLWRGGIRGRRRRCRLGCRGGWRGGFGVGEGGFDGVEGEEADGGFECCAFGWDVSFVVVMGETGGVGTYDYEG
jgi:hypothetical protein